jgi:serine O-acetyltransferase
MTEDNENPDVLDIRQAVSQLAEQRRLWRARHQQPGEPVWNELPSIDSLRPIVASLRGALFPMRLGATGLREEGADLYVGHTLESALHALLRLIKLELRHARRLSSETDPAVIADSLRMIQTFTSQLPGIRKLLDQDAIAAYEGDPAARSVDEVLLAYPGMHALIHHRLAHALYTLGAPLVARLIAEMAHRETGIDIHPGARIGQGCFIDHGTGVVIGETAIIGERVRLYQAVTLGARSFPTDSAGQAVKGQPRHPIVEDDVVIYAGATVLGRVTIGRGASIGGNAWVTEDVPAGARLSQARLRRAKQDSPRW